MCPPAEFGGLRALADKSVDRPGIDEFARLLGHGRDLRIALRDMDHLDADRIGKVGPFAAGRGDCVLQSSIPCQFDQSLFYEMRTKTGMCAVRRCRVRD